MRNFLYAGNIATEGAVTEARPMVFGLAHRDSNGVLSFSDGTNLDKDEELYFVLARPAEIGGPVVLPFFNHKFRYTYSTFEAATKFVAEIALPSSVMPGVDYTILLVKKGLKFNERNRWHVTAKAKAGSDISTIAESLVKQVNAMTDTVGLIATYIPSNADGGKIQFEAADAFLGKDYSILGADELIDAEVTVVSKGLSARNDLTMMRDFADKAAANVGYEYTYLDDVHYLYPDYPAGKVIFESELLEAEFTVYNIFFAEPRKVKTVDEVVNQLIQVAFTRPEFVEFVRVLDELKK